ncbi:hypothetical protein COW64_17300 [bacterium (Candidatus Blackallbacteria) CG18_big_fil_WC_8_21_14_2_50_49_26]|nr:MAG: hypothetical protein COW64_17300 [bacterium (Candidatus Blackallbacteria) CG18_big_fil_WC_8_21_14_2_50_49_26]
MATLAKTSPTLLDYNSRRDPDGMISQIVELLEQENAVLRWMAARESNLATGHMSTQRTGISAGTWRKLYGFVQPDATETRAVTDNIGWQHKYTEIDVELADLEGNTQAFRLSEDKGKIQGMNQEVARATFYGNEGTQPEIFTGLAPRYNSLSAPNAENIINAGGSGSDNGSIWLVHSTPETIFYIWPKGSEAGLKVEDKGQQTLTSTSGNMEVYRTHYSWAIGLSVRDWRHAVRIANIDKSDLSVVFNAGEFGGVNKVHLPNLIYKAIRHIPQMAGGNSFLCMSRDMITVLQQQAAAATQGSTLSAENVGGVFTELFHGIPIARCDVLAADEAVVS